MNQPSPMQHRLRRVLCTVGLASLAGVACSSPSEGSAEDRAELRRAPPISYTTISNGMVELTPDGTLYMVNYFRSQSSFDVGLLRVDIR